MKRNSLLILAVIVSIFLSINSTKKILTFRTTFQEVEEAEKRLENLKKENENLKKEFEYKKSNDFAEGEIRNKLGLVKEGEVVVIVPREEVERRKETGNQRELPNWQKWRNLFFGS
ncbi:hypothetical protein A2697_04200 [Candidatus Curtissbacteria bacterium RIFCSPHIGHO2_01_FULL_41_44]|uniref:Septum formation initiator n=1 Tax=Candidatus Curtissbacteria bacterium RIFCSPLOWO2_01_FULL_42_50 TaxID=1797730 RepID=A0A1F5H2Q2_9BACT|nr:MAG: hypothetical protein A3C33_04140 [Candidatus Curtissbacteria bacterium RIFCSPHIGHO2_02_FULL_42_58]OGD93765.1 MAG: hypothetical protein A2697_04200 [Candidatus Curtissbacteria bacterium RIFCSPHIGHO2_01_FULL_41_44]OGD97263.1 MAG: hypothetical protein A3E71_04350 [Candidatus Curtissbacteria bacterium RIFCSPHIGHO2_12_FULL_42_33]OGD98413.1 MAG: hypothetical protein A3B54_03700 [Candidatus Curtissbacteria bacterium RIFCSPLOWO2_01_FULL_42_50]OGE02330.1 MAG: hypothetical protein A3G16_03835 [Ca